MDTPLLNRKIIITREKEQAAYLVKSLEGYGAECLVFPMINISAPDDWSDCDKALLEISTYDWIVFSSANGVRYFWNRARDINSETYNNKIAVVGKKTLRELESFGLKSNLIPETFSAAGLIKSFLKENIKGKRILNPTSEIARDELQTGLENLGAIVNRITVYKNECYQNQFIENIVNAIEQNEIDAVLFFSPSAFKCFTQILGPKVCDNFKQKKAVIAAIGSTTAEAIKQSGFNVDIIPEKGLQEYMVKAVVDYFRESC